MQVEYVSNDSLFKCWISTYNTLIQYHIGFVTLVTQHEACATYILKYHELSSLMVHKISMSMRVNICINYGLLSGLHCFPLSPRPL